MHRLSKNLSLYFKTTSYDKQNQQLQVFQVAQEAAAFKKAATDETLVGFATINVFTGDFL